MPSIDDAGPFLAVQQLALHSAPEPFDHGVVITIPHRFEAESRAVFVNVAGKGPLGELRPVVGVNDSSGGWLHAALRHEQSRVH